jgi:hypothetical protein
MRIQAEQTPRDPNSVDINVGDRGTRNRADQRWRPSNRPTEPAPAGAFAIQWRRVQNPAGRNGVMQDPEPKLPPPDPDPDPLAPPSLPGPNPDEPGPT